MMRKIETYTNSRRILIAGILVCFAPTAIYTSRDGETEVVTRCYCNEAACVTTGYMCKTSLGACFAQRSPGGDHIRYACANWLGDVADRRLCVAAASVSPDYVIKRRVTSPTDVAHQQWTELACCSTDMCNYYYFRSQQVLPAVDWSAGNHLTTNTSTDLKQQQQQQDDEPRQQVSSLSTSSSVCLQTVVMVTVPLCVAVLLTLAAVVTLYALSANRRRMMTSPSAALPVPVAGGGECRCAGRQSWLVPTMQCSECRSLPVIVSDEQPLSKHQHLPHHNYEHHHQPPPLLTISHDVRRPPTSPTLNPAASNYSESTQLLVAKDAWKS